MNRTDFQKLANLRVKDAKVLLNNGCFEGAYYLLGYSIECALKACVAKKTQRYDFPDKKLANNVFTHELPVLLALAGLKPVFDAELKVNPTLDANWAIVKDWNESSRYVLSVDANLSKGMYAAAASRKNGVLPWLKKQW